MSLINKMLQDLDARGTPAVDAFPSSVRPVAPERRVPALRLVGAGAALVSIAGVALAWLAWHHFYTAAPSRDLAPPAAPRLVAIKPVQGMGGTITPAPAAANAPAPQTAPAGAVQPQARALAPATLPASASTSAAAPPGPVFDTTPQPLPQPHADDSTGPAAIVRKSVPPMEPDSAQAREARRAAALELATRASRMARLARLAAKQPHSAGAPAASKGNTEAEGRQESPGQRAENDYRRALASLQDGRVEEAIASLQRALRIDPGHDAARQTLVGLLVEGGRTDDAIHQLQLGLAQDPGQPALAMLLARLQIERGGSGIETLMRSLPYVGNSTPESAEYRAFLAGALERQQRHREAALQYQQALRSAPGNGVWWMGLGLSLQADKRNAEALDAFQRARASGSLNPDLQAFVERRIRELAH